MDHNRELEALKTKVLAHEKIILDTCLYDFQIIHPHKFIIKLAREFKCK